MFTFNYKLKMREKTGSAGEYMEDIRPLFMGARLGLLENRPGTSKTASNYQVNTTS